MFEDKDLDSGVAKQNLSTSKSTIQKNSNYNKLTTTNRLLFGGCILFIPRYHWLTQKKRVLCSARCHTVSSIGRKICILNADRVKDTTAGNPLGFLESCVGNSNSDRGRSWSEDTRLASMIYFCSLS